MNADRLTETFVELADTLVEDFDVVEFLRLLTDRSAELAGVDAAALLLADPRGQLELIATAGNRLRSAEPHHPHTVEGPGVDAFTTGAPVDEPDLHTHGHRRWPRFTAAAEAAGFAAVDAVPMRLRTDVLGALSLFRTAPGPLDAAALRTATSLVEIATIGLVQHRSIHHHQVLAEQLQSALTSRVAIEQAKGLVAERLQVDMDGAFAALRGFARATNLKLGDVARAVIEGRLSTRQLLSPDPRRKPHRA
ncbi:GAF and ANTAR domain-containing protein [Actinokineospora sp. PR83]|uniref:GAF and ANTAR domain-containing protein n=1 Tax=Actinokineospora sp. PR83 TaxID=2884908 RepID=UPI001F1CD6FD|nr:GAF and ANTAR domain-containing protein [Actinokineospora sp. PR83]MCG8916054.1 GAF and ANTAR domain-containing protein [Actinokineospora sp. PR83]